MHTLLFLLISTFVFWAEPELSNWISVSVFQPQIIFKLFLILLELCL